MKTFKTLILSSLVAGIVAPAFADLNKEIAPSFDIGDAQAMSAEEQEILTLKEAGLDVPAYLYELVNAQYGLDGVEIDVNRVGGGGEDIATAQVILGLPFSDTGDTGTKVDDYDEACPYTGSTSPDAVYSYAPAADGVIDIDLCNSSYDTKLFVYENVHTPTLPYACVDDSCPGYKSDILAMPVLAGNIYYIVVDGYGGESGTFELNITDPVSVVCDPIMCVGTPEVEPNEGANADPVVFNPIAIGETVCGTNFTFDNNGTDSRDTDWFELVTTTDVALTIDLDVEDYDAVLYLLDMEAYFVSGDPGDIGVAYSSDVGGNCEDEQIVTDCLLGGAFYIFVGPATFTGVEIPANYGLTVSAETCVVPLPPANDNFADAIEMFDGDCVMGSTVLATPDAGPFTMPDCNGSSIFGTSTGGAADVWYSFMSTGACYTISLCGSTYDTALGVFDEFGVELMGTDDNCGLQSEITECYIPAGMTFVAVDGYGSSTGDYMLCLNACPIAEAVDGPVAFDLKQNYPNPFNPTTNIDFTIESTEMVNLSVYSVNGQKVATLINGMVESGSHSVTFDASNLTSGVYFYTLSANGISATSKMILMK
jgi:hypothetical protein